MKRDGLLVGLTRVALSFALLWSCMFAGMIRTVEAKGTIGEYSGNVIDTSAYFPRNSNSWALDQAGTRWNFVDDVEKRQMLRSDSVSFQGNVAIATGSQAVSAFYNWTLAIATASVNGERQKVRITVPKDSISQVLVGLATGAVSGALTFPTTDYYIAWLNPGDSLELNVSSFVHPVLLSTHTAALPATVRVKTVEFAN